MSSLDSFSLVELLVAIAVLSILVILLMGMLGSLLTTWQQGQAHNERRTTAQAVLDRMSRDISQAALPAARNNTNGINFVITPSWITAPGLNHESIFFQAPVATDGGGQGNLAVVGYYVKWVNNTSTLIRVLINPTSPDGSGSDYNVYSATPSSWITDTLLAKTNYTAAVAPSYSGLLAENVLGVWVQGVDPTGAVISQSGVATGAYDSRVSYSYFNNSQNNGSGLTVTNYASALPARVQLAIVVVDSRTAKQLTAAPSYTAPTANMWSDVQTFYNALSPAVRKGAEIQTTTIPLANGPR